MSGILGVVNLDGRPVDSDWLNGMWSILSHRGPDGGLVWVHGCIGLGHQMLWTTPESMIEKLPYTIPGADMTIVADARVDNREELIAAMSLRNAPDSDKTDSQLILAAYQKWGDGCVDRLIGDFAFAIWNGRNQSIFCARDHFGIRPFYYYYKSGSCFLFASEIKALLTVPIIPHCLNETRVADYLDSFVEDEEITFYQDIKRLPRSQWMRVNRTDCNFRKYWSLDPTREIRYRSNEAYAEAFREQFFQAVSCRLRSAFPIGASLSGGLDSSSVVQVSRGMLKQNGNLPLHTFSAIFDDVPQSDERYFINLIPKGADLSPHFIHLDQFGALADIDSTLWHVDQPMYIRNMFLWTTKYKMAKDLGIRVFLDGEDGDTVVSHGYSYLTELALLGRWKEFSEVANSFFRHSTGYQSNRFWLRSFGYPCMEDMAQKWQLLLFAKAVFQIPRYFAVSRWDMIRNQGLRATVPESWRKSWRRLLRKNVAIEQKNRTLVNEELAERVHFAERKNFFESITETCHTLREGHCQGLNHAIHSCLSEESNKAAAAYNIEIRHPFYDRRLVEFCLALPPEQKFQQGWPRWAIRNAMKRILPEEICWRVGKSNLSYNFCRCLLMLEQEKISNILVNETQSIKRYVNMDFFRDAYRKEIGDIVWPPVILALWLRQFN